MAKNLNLSLLVPAPTALKQRTSFFSVDVLPNECVQLPRLTFFTADEFAGARNYLPRMLSALGQRVIMAAKEEEEDHATDLPSGSPSPSYGIVQKLIFGFFRS